MLEQYGLILYDVIYGIFLICNTSMSYRAKGTDYHNKMYVHFN